MVTKSISLATGLVSLDVSLQSRLSSNDPLFLFVSSGLIVNLLMMGLALAAIYVSFRKKFNNWYSYAACTAVAAVFVCTGFMGIFYSDYVHSLWSTMLPLNYILMMQVGIILGICSLSYDHDDMPAIIRQRLQSLAQLPKPNFVLPVPKTLHPPLSFRRLSGGAH